MKQAGLLKSMISVENTRQLKGKEVKYIQKTLTFWERKQTIVDRRSRQV
jgi:hypothetical protein